MRSRRRFAGALTLERTLDGMPEEKRPDIRPQLRELLAWYEEVLGRIESGAVVAPGEQDRLTAEASAVAHVLDLGSSTEDGDTDQARDHEIAFVSTDVRVFRTRTLCAVGPFCHYLWGNLRDLFLQADWIATSATSQTSGC